ncbi:hypothetical protein OQA88_5637 [Cercophora sp. LCS_1]
MFAKISNMLSKTNKATPSPTDNVDEDFVVIDVSDIESLHPETAEGDRQDNTSQLEQFLNSPVPSTAPENEQDPHENITDATDSGYESGRYEGLDSDDSGSEISYTANSASSDGSGSEASDNSVNDSHIELRGIVANFCPPSPVKSDLPAIVESLSNIATNDVVRVVLPYQRWNTWELNLKPGDVVSVETVFENGWAKGTKFETKEDDGVLLDVSPVGHFPLSVVTPIKGFSWDS